MCLKLGRWSCKILLFLLLCVWMEAGLSLAFLQPCPAMETSERAHYPPQQSLSEAARKEKEIVLRSQIEIVKSRQPVWDSSKLVAELDKVSKGGYSYSIVPLACQTPFLNLALLAAAWDYDPPLHGAETSWLLKFVDRDIRELALLFDSFEQKQSKPSPVLPGLLEKERLSLARGFRNHYHSDADLCYLNHLVKDGAVRQILLEEIGYQSNSLDTIKTSRISYKPAELKDVFGGTFDVAKVLRGLLDQVDSAFAKGDTDLVDNLYWKMIHIAQEHKCKELAKAIADCYRTFLCGIKHRSQPTYSERLEYVDKLLEM